MPGISRVGVDSASGLIQGDLAPTVSVNGSHIAVQGAAIPSIPTAMVTASSTVFANGIGVCRAGDIDGILVAATGSSDVFAG